MLSDVMAVLFPQDSKVFHVLIHSLVTVPQPLPDIVEFWRMCHDCRRTLGDMGRLSGVPIISFNTLSVIQGLQQKMAKDCDVISLSAWERAIDPHNVSSCNCCSQFVPQTRLLGKLVGRQLPPVLLSPKIGRVNIHMGIMEWVLLPTFEFRFDLQEK
jgi:hypothetical protein